jgi:(2Fe-2S) ferredoxin
MRLRTRLARLIHGRNDIGLIGYACFGLCEFGPNVAFFPEGAYFGGLEAEDDAQRVVDHAAGTRALADLPLPMSIEERAAHRRNVEDLIALAERERNGRKRRRWWWPF